MINQLQIGDKALITKDCWFIAPNGESYRSVHGTVSAILNDQESLGIKTNARSSNWYVVIGNMMLAGCQIHYAIKSDRCNFHDITVDLEHEGKSVREQKRKSSIYNADE